MGLGKSRLWRFTWRKRLVRFAFIGILVYFLVAFLAPLICTHLLDLDPTKTNLDRTFEGPSLEHFFGTDGLGRDVFARTVFAMRNNALIALMVLVFGGWFLNVILALLAGYFGGKIDAFILRVGEVLGAIHPLIFLVIVTVAFGDRFDAFLREIFPWVVEVGLSKILLIFIALSLIAWVGGVYVLRSRVLQEREQGYVESLRALGASDFRIMFYHILPNLMGLIILSLSGILFVAIISEVSLSFLGLGIREPHASFGVILFKAADLGFLRNHPHLLIPPGIVLCYVGMLSWILGDQWGRIMESKRSYL